MLYYNLFLKWGICPLWHSIKKTVTRELAEYSFHQGIFNSRILELKGWCNSGIHGITHDSGKKTKNNIYKESGPDVKLN